ncbi:MAG TPA: hypothetical protein VII40_18880 [Xanthobacteraceae bacterium]
MSVASINAGEDFRVGDVLSRAWSVFTGNVIFFLAVPLLINGFYLIVNFALGSLFAVFRIAPVSSRMVPTAPGMVPASPWIIFVVSIGTLIVLLCLHMLGLGVLLMGAFQRLRGEPLRIGAALQRALARLLPLVAVGILVTLAMLGVFLACIAVLWVLGLVLGGLAAVLMLGMFVPLFILWVMWSVVVPACLVEGLGPIESMARSADLTRGYRWKITGIMLLFMLIASAAGIIVIILLALMRFNPVLVLILEVAAGVVLTAYFDCALIMIYHDLRVAKEGVDTSQIASVFD